MTNTLLIQPLDLDPADFPPLPLDPGFAQLVSDEMGNQATPTDGFDAIFGELLGFVNELDSTLGTLGDELGSAFQEAATIDPAPIGDAISSFTDGVNTLSGHVDNLSGLQSPPLGDNPLNLGIFVKQSFASSSTVKLPQVKAGSPAYKVTISLTNPAPFVIGIGKPKLDGDTAVFTHLVSIAPDPWLVSTTLTVVLEVNPAAAGHYTGRLRFGIRGPSMLSLAGLTWLIALHVTLDVTA